MQRTFRQRRAAERDAPSPLDRPSRGLRGVQREQPGHGKPRAGLPHRGLGRRAAATDFRGQALRAINSHAQAPAGIEPAASWPPLRGKSQAIEHNRAFCKVQPVANRVGLVAAPLRLRLRALRVRRRVGYVWRPCAASRGAGFARAAQQPVGALAAAPPTRVFSQALRASVENEPRPPRAVCCARLRPCGPPFACSQPSLPSAPQAGLPKVQRQPRTVGRKLPPFAQGA